MTIPDIILPNGITLAGETLYRFLWAGRESGLVWLSNLPELIEDVCARWDIELISAVPPMSLNLVLFGESAEHGPVVIKMSPPHEEVLAEAEALRLHDSPHVVRLLHHDPEVSAIVLHRVTPGTTLRSKVEAGTLSEMDAAAIAAELMQQYWLDAPEDHVFFDLHRWFRSLYAYRDAHREREGRIPQRHVELAVRAADHLLATHRGLVTLHGDLHHDNILLDAENGWTIIDPKGLVGERGYDIGTWMLNPVGVDVCDDLPQLTAERLDFFAESLGIDRFRLWQWAMAHSVLSDCWNLDTGEDAYLHANAIAAVLAEMPEASREPS